MSPWGGGGHPSSSRGVAREAVLLRRRKWWDRRLLTIGVSLAKSILKKATICAIVFALLKASEVLLTGISWRPKDESTRE